MRLFFIALLFSSLFTCLSADTMLVEDPFDSFLLEKSLHKKNEGGNYRTAFYLPLSQTQLFSSHPVVQSLWRLCVGSLAQKHVGGQNLWAPFLATHIEKAKAEGEVYFEVTLRSDVFWQALETQNHFNQSLSSFFCAKKPLTSKDFKLTIDILKNPYYQSASIEQWKKKYRWIKRIEVIDDHHFKLFASSDLEKGEEESIYDLMPLASHWFLYDANGHPLLKEDENPSLSKSYAHALKSHWAMHLIPSCGPWRVYELRTDYVQLKKNEDFPLQNQAFFDEMTFTLKNSESNAWQAFKIGEIDSHFLTPFQIQDFEKFMSSKTYARQKKKGGAIETYEYLAPLYYFIGWNQENPFFSEKKVRRALSHAIPYDFIIEEFLKGCAQRITGPLMPGSKAYDAQLTPLAFDLKMSLHLLQESGFEKDPKRGLLVEKKTQKPFQFKLLFYQQNETAALICQSIAAALKELGIDCILQGESYEGFFEKVSSNHFDAFFMAWSLTQPIDHLEDIWQSSYQQPSSLNFIHFKHAQVDERLNQIRAKSSYQEKEDLAKEIHRILYEEQPYTFLYLPKQILLYRSYLKNVALSSNELGLQHANLNLSPCPRVFYFSKKPYETLPSL